MFVRGQPGATPPGRPQGSPPHIHVYPRPYGKEGCFQKTCACKPHPGRCKHLLPYCQGLILELAPYRLYSSGTHCFQILTLDNPASRMISFVGPCAWATSLGLCASEPTLTGVPCNAQAFASLRTRLG